MMQDNLDFNPFRAPASEQLSDSKEHVRVDFVPILHRWEKLRVWYNAVLITLTVAGSIFRFPHLMLDPLFLFQICLGGLVTNLCFFTGPAIEGYGRYFGLWNVGLSIALFAAGLIFTCLLATLFLIVRTR